MKFLCTIILCILTFTIGFAQTNNYDQQWSKIDSLEHYRDLKAAIPLLKNLMDQAQEDSLDLSAKAHYVKALIFKNKYEVQLELGLTDSIGGEQICYSEIIKVLKPRLLKATKESNDPVVQSLLYANLADLLAKYQRDFYPCNNIARIARRYEINADGTYGTISDPVQDSLDKVLFQYQEETTNYLLLAIAKPETKTVWAADYTLLLNQKERPEVEGLKYSLYDLLVENTIEHLVHRTHYTTYKFKSKDYPFRDSLAFVPVEDFVQFDFTVADETANKIQIYKLYQELLKTHLNSGQRDLFAKLDRDQQNLLAKFDLDRMTFGLEHNYSVIQKHKSYYLARLLDMEQRYLEVSTSTMISYQIAKNLLNTYYTGALKGSIYDNRWNKKRAYTICQAAIKRFPKSIGAKNCQALINQILQKELSLSIEAVNPTNQSILAKIQSNNIKNIYCKLLPLPKDYYKEKAALDLLDGAINRDSIWAAYISKIKSPKSNIWEQNIPLAGDFKNRSIEIKIPAQQSGAYLLILSHKADFSYDNNGLVYAYLQVSDLAFLARARYVDKKTVNELFILNRKNGAPIQQAKVQFLDKNWKQIEVKKSDDQGHLTKIFDPIKPYSIRIEKGNDQLYLDDTPLNYYNYTSTRELNKAYLFTDKPIYRPGQTIHYKGILTHLNKDRTSDILPNKNTKISFYDANRQQVAETKIITNDYGAYSGIFIVPSSGLLGKMYLQDSLTQSVVYFNVEEYKKPTIQSTLESFVIVGETMDTLISHGLANTFSGMPLIDAQVQYSIIKDYTDTLSVGTTFVNNNGRFHIKLEIPKETDTLVFLTSYEVNTTIIDLTGETKENGSYTQYLNPNYKSKFKEQASIEVKFSHESEVLRSDTALIASYKARLDQNGIKTAVKIKSELIIEFLECPKHPYINRLWSAPDTSIFTPKDFEESFPLYEFHQNQRKLENWKILDTIYQADFEAATAKEWRLNTQNWETGSYRIYLVCTDSTGYEWLENPRYFRVEDHFPSPSYNTALAHYNKDAALIGEPNDTVLLEVGSYFQDAHILLELESNYKVHEYRWLQPKDYQKVPVLITEKHRGNLHYRLFSIYNNRFQETEDFIQVPWTNKKLNIEYLSFRDNLLPGQTEEWTIKITGPDGEAVAAEILASMYDSALDELSQRSWKFDLYKNTYYRSLKDWSSQDNIKEKAFYVNQHPNWQAPTLNISTLNNPSIKSPQSFLKFNRFWYSKAPTAEDLDGDGVPNAQDMEPNSLPYYRVTSQGRNIVEPEPLLWFAEQQVFKSENESYQIINAIYGNNVYAFAYEDSLAISTAGIPVAYESLDVDETANRRNFTTSEVTKTTSFNDVKIRSNLSESVFFYPHLKTDDDGSISIKFTMSEALSRWKFRTVAHTKDLKTIVTTKDLVTQKKLMVMPSTPRFLRQGDVIEITSKVANLSTEVLKGEITLQLFDATTKAPIDLAFDNKNTIQTFDLEKGAVTKVHWTLRIPDTWTNPVLYKVIAKSGNFSDGEQNQLPVLSNRMLVLESLPILAHGNSQQTYVFKGLKENTSPTLQQHQFSLELSPNPAWDALLSLPYLIEYPYECSEQLFARFYANSLATQIVNSTPKIKATFEAWAAKEIPDSSLNELLKNPSLKSALLEETPWVLDAKSDAEQQKRLGQLFDLNQMAKEAKKVGNKLLERQAEDGGFAWFDGGSSSPFITQYIVGGLAKLEKLGANPLSKNKRIQKMTDNALLYMDQQLITQYKNLISYYKNKSNRKKDADAMRLEDNLSHNAIQYLYAKSFFWKTNDLQKDSTLTRSINYYLEQAKLHWRNKSIHQQGVLALAAHRINPKSQFAKMIVDSLKSQAIVDSTEGMYWEQSWGFYWYELPIETQAIMMELFEDVAKDEGAIYLLKLWLLQQKKGAAWASTKATTTASYALLMSGENWLENQGSFDIKIGNQNISSAEEAQETQTGYFKKTWSAENIQKDFANITIDNKNPSPAFGAAYWQYFEDFENIKTFQETPLKIKKELFLQTQTTKGSINTPIQESILKPGDLILVRIELEVGKEMEYLHLKDRRAAGFEPTNVLSAFKYQNGMGYYEMTKDASSNFFFSQLTKGKYVFEYTLRAVHKGQFSNGITTIQSMYAPEFTAHSEALDIIIK
jgi:uncharacterized protein YfaS (alpha-2-macroglobulin family)